MRKIRYTLLSIFTSLIFLCSLLFLIDKKDNSNKVNAAVNYFSIDFDSSSNGKVSLTSTDFNFQYSLDGSNWNDFPLNNYAVSGSKSIKIRGNNPNGFHKEMAISRPLVISGNLDFSISGDISTLISHSGGGSIASIDSCFESFFISNLHLISAKDLVIPYTEIGRMCFSSAFFNCTNLKYAPELPATIIDDFGYFMMFERCNSLLEAPALPATSIGNCAYESMFSDCVSLAKANKISANDIPYSACEEMFSGCCKLTSMPQICAKTIDNYGCSEMFSGCTSLVNVVPLDASSVLSEGYSNMFSGCTSLTTSPEIKATTLQNNSLSNMFSGCNKLNRVYVDFTSWVNGATTNWLNGVSSSGYVVTTSNIGIPSNDVSHIPTGWDLGRKYIVSFKANGGNGTMDDAEVIGSWENEVRFTICDCSFTPPSSVPFQGWSLSQNGIIIRTPTIKLTKDITYLYACWTKHTYAVITYTWNDANECTGMRVCTDNVLCSERETVAGVYVKDSNASCVNNEKGHFEATFEHILFSSQSTPANSYEVLNTKINHDYNDPTYTWNEDNQCIATRICKNDPTHIETETADGEYIKDKEATCGTNEFGHFIATFENIVFETQYTDNNSFEVIDSATSHDYDTPTYVWNEDNQCIATRICKNDPTHIETETVDGEYIKDTEATCETNEFGHLIATFENIAFEVQYTTENSYEVLDTMLSHDYYSPTYVWDENFNCIAIRICKNNQEHIETETVKGEYIKDKEATCEINEFGHYVATFENDTFETQYTNNNSFEVIDSATGHDYDIPTYVWNEYNQCIATRICKKDSTHIETETVDGEYIKDKEATCETNEFGHLIATFENIAFEVQCTTENSYEILNTATGHSYEKVVYEWDDNKCTATAICHCGHNKEETVEAVFIEDTPATCSTNKKGHYIAEFTGEYDTQQTPQDYVEIPNSTNNNHICGPWIDKIDETHISVGFKGHSVCSLCNQNIDSDGNVIDSLIIDKIPSHKYDNVTYIWGDDNKKVTAMATCICGDTLIEIVDVEEIDGQYVAKFKNDTFETQTKSKKSGRLIHIDFKNKVFLYIGVGVGGAILVGAIIFSIIKIKKKRRQKFSSFMNE